MGIWGPEKALKSASFDDKLAVCKGRPRMSQIDPLNPRYSSSLGAKRGGAGRTDGRRTDGRTFLPSLTLPKKFGAADFDDFNAHLKRSLLNGDLGVRSWGFWVRIVGDEQLSGWLSFEGWFFDSGPCLAHSTQSDFP